MKSNQKNKLELNTKLLKNFDKIMSVKLDAIEELKITELDNGAKLLNVISLCPNLKTLVIDADGRMNCDKVFANLFKPAKIENLVLTGINLTKKDSLRKFVGLKMLSLNNIRIGDVSELLNNVPNKRMLEILNIENVDMQNKSLRNLNNFKNLKYLKLNNIHNCKIDEMKFLKNSNKILKVDIHNVVIYPSEINNLLRVKGKKNVSAFVVAQNGEKLENCIIEMDDEKSKVISTSYDLHYLYKKMDLYKIQEFCITLNKKVNDLDYIKYLEKYHKTISIKISNFLFVNVEHAEKLKSIGIKKIQVEKNGKVDEYKIEDYISIRSEIDKIISSTSKHVSESEKFLEIYKYIGDKYKIVEKEKNNIKTHKCDETELVDLFQACLECAEIQSNIISGEDLENNRNHVWNQVKLEGKWYNTDLVGDMEYIKKKKTEYCLLSDKTFFKTHTPKSGINNYCPEDFNSKLVKVFFKTGLFKEKLWSSYLETTLEKIKSMFNASKKEQILLLPEPEEKNLKN